jgi:hypothetical protein
MILNRREQYIRNVHRELNARQVKYRKHSSDYIENDADADALTFDKITKDNDKKKAEAKRKRELEKQAIFELRLKVEKQLLKENILKYLNQKANIQISMYRFRFYFLEDYKLKRKIHLINEDFIEPIYNLLCEYDDKECDTIIFSLHNSNLRALKYKEYKFVSEIYPSLLFGN